MKKHLLLLALPLVLGLCAFGGNKAVNNYFLEDSSEHEEMFGDLGEQVQINRKVQREGEVAPVITDFGVQGFSDDNYYHLRFVATVADPDNIETAVWTRAAFDSATGGELLAEAEFDKVTYYYTSIKDGDSVSTADEGFGYVVYVLKNIPKASAKDYIRVNLSLTNAVGTTVSKLGVATADLSSQVSFDRGETKFYLLKEGQTPIAQDAVTKGNDAENNYGSFTTSLNKDNSFVIFGQDGSNNNFKVINSSSLRGDVSNYSFVDVNGSIKVNYKADYVLYLNKSSELWTSFDNIERPLYIKIELGWWNDANAVTKIYGVNNSVNPVQTKLYDVEVSGSFLQTTTNYDFAKYPQLTVLRLDPKKGFDWGNGSVRNQSVDTNVPSRNSIDDCVYVYNEKVEEKYKTSISHR